RRQVLRKGKAIRKEKFFVTINRIAPGEAFLPFTCRVHCFTQFANAVVKSRAFFEVTADRQVPLVDAECFLQLFVSATVKVSADDDLALACESPAEQMPARQQQFCKRELVAESKQ